MAEHTNAQNWQIFFPVDTQPSPSLSLENNGDAKKARGGRRKSTSTHEVETNLIHPSVSLPVVPQPILEKIIKDLDKETSNSTSSTMDNSSFETNVKILQRNSDFYLCSCQIPILPHSAEEYFLDLQRQKHPSSTTTAEIVKNYIQDHNAEEIVRERQVANQSVEYLIKWKAYDPCDSSWVSKKYAERYLPYQLRKYKKKIDKMNGDHIAEVVSVEQLAKKFAHTLNKIGYAHLTEEPELTIEHFRAIKCLILEHAYDIYLLKQQFNSISLSSFFNIKDPQLQESVKEELEYQIQQLFVPKYMFAANSSAYEKEKENLQLWIKDQL